MASAVKHGALMLLVAGCWATSVIFSKHLQDDCNFVKPYFLAYVHEVALGVFCAPAAWVAAEGDHRRFRATAWDLAAKACSFGLLAFASNCCFTAALHFAEASTAMTLEQLCTVFVAVLSFCFLRERYTILQMVGLSAAVAGAVLTAQVGAKTGGAHSQPWLGNILVVLASAGSALYMVGLRKALGGVEFDILQLMVFFVVKGIAVGLLGGAAGLALPVDAGTTPAKPCAWVYFLGNLLAAVGFNLGLALAIFAASPLASRLFILLGLPLSLLADMLQGMRLRAEHVLGMALVMLGVACFECARGGRTSAGPGEASEEVQELTTPTHADSTHRDVSARAGMPNALCPCSFTRKQWWACILAASAGVVAIVLVAVLWLARAQRGDDSCAASYSPATLGHQTWPLPDASPKVQMLFDQALLLCYSFNHDEALRSLRRALALAPTEPMLYWLHAYALSGNLNRPLTDADRLREAQEAVEGMLNASRAVGCRSLAMEEQLLIGAMQRRFPDERVAAKTWVTDHDIAAYELLRHGSLQLSKPSAHYWALLGQAAMETTPWVYHSEGGRLAPVADEALRALLAATAADPNHALAHHYLIHLLESQRPVPQPAVDAANKLATLFGKPGPGHLSHMPSHSYIGAGDYHAASESNQRAIAADDRYFAACEGDGVSTYNSYYKALYYCHKHAVLLTSLEHEGRLGDALAVADALVTRCKINIVAETIRGVFSTYRDEALRLLMLVRFGKWNEVLRQTTPPPANSSPFGTAVLHFARACAFAATAATPACAQAFAERDLFGSAALAAGHGLIFGVTRLNDTIVRVSMSDILRVANMTLNARLEASCLAPSTHMSLRDAWQAAADAAADLPYFEPPFWRLDPRLCLGEHLRSHGQLFDAKAAFSGYLRDFPNSAWGLFGLWKVEEAFSSNRTEISRLATEFKAAWMYSDFELATACY